MTAGGATMGCFSSRGGRPGGTSTRAMVGFNDRARRTSSSYTRRESASGSEGQYSSEQRISELRKSQICYDELSGGGQPAESPLTA
jgi:hypothetical protein